MKALVSLKWCMFFFIIPKDNPRDIDMNFIPVFETEKANLSRSDTCPGVRVSQWQRHYLGLKAACLAGMHSTCMSSEACIDLFQDKRSSQPGTQGRTESIAI